MIAALIRDVTDPRRLPDSGGAALGVRLVVAASTAVAIIATIAPSWGAPDAIVWLAIVSGVAGVVSPDSLAPLTFAAAIAGSWALRAPGDVDGWLIAAVLGVLAVHVGCALAASMPSSAEIESQVLVRWAVTGAVLVGVTLAAAGVLALLARTDLAGALALTVGALGGVTVLVWWSSGVGSHDR